MPNSKFDMFSNIPEHASISHIIDEFRFDKVQTHMTAVNWTWGFTLNSNGIPSINELKRCATRLLVSLRSDTRESCSLMSGGFAVYKIDGILSLHFYVEQTDEYDVYNEYGIKY